MPEAAPMLSANSSIGPLANPPRVWGWCALLAATVTILAIWLGGDRGFDVYDASYCWYGPQATLAGGVPQRDFASYDPGRQYGPAALMALAGDSGFVSFRRAETIFRGLGLFAALVLIAGVGPRGRELWWLIAWAVIFGLWMHPYARITSIWLVVALAWLAARPSCRRHFGAGVVIGLVAFVGRNHGVYGVIGYLLLVTSQWIGGNPEWKWSRVWRGALALGLGIVLGYSPMLGLIAFCPGFAESFWEKLAHMIELKKTNIKLDVPWPWYAGRVGGLRDIPGQISTGLYFVALAVGIATSWLLVVWRTRRGAQLSAGLLAAAALLVPYAHYPFSRADVYHLAGGIFPFLIWLAIFLVNTPRWSRWVGTAFVFATSAVTMADLQVAYTSRRHHWRDWVQVGHDRVLVAKDVAAQVNMVNAIHEKYALPGRSFLAMPGLTGAYPMAGQASPVFEIYPLFAQTEAFQRKEIARIQAADPAYVMMNLNMVDGRADYHFKVTYPFVYKYIMDNYVPVADPVLLPNHHLLLPASRVPEFPVSP